MGKFNKYYKLRVEIRGEVIILRWELKIIEKIKKKRVVILAVFEKDWNNYNQKLMPHQALLIVIVVVAGSCSVSG